MFKKLKQFFKLLWETLTDWKNLVILIIVMAVVGCEVWVPLLLGLIFHNTYLLSIAAVCEAFWLMPSTPFLAICIPLTLYIRSLIERRKILKNIIKYEKNEEEPLVIIGIGTAIAKRHMLKKYKKEYESIIENNDLDVCNSCNITNDGIYYLIGKKANFDDITNDNMFRSDVISLKNATYYEAKGKYIHTYHTLISYVRKHEKATSWIEIVPKENRESDNYICTIIVLKEE